MYIENNRLYARGFSLELPQDIRIVHSPSILTFFRNDEPWILSICEFPGQFGEAEFKREVSDIVLNNDIATLQTTEKTINGVPFFQVTHTYSYTPENSACSCFLTTHIDDDGEGFWMSYEVDACYYSLQPDENHHIVDHPVFNAFINSISKCTKH